MLKSPEFEVQLSGSHAVYFPIDIGQPFLKQGKDRVKVIARHEGKELSFHAALQQRHNQLVITFSRAKQDALSIFKNDVFTLQLYEDTSQYGVDIPEELTAVLALDPVANKIFESLTDGRKRSLIYMIMRYKNPQTKIDKSLLLCENLKRGVRNPKELLKSF